MSGLVIIINAGATKEESSVSATGENVNIIADSERASFGIGSDDDLKRAVEKYFGKRPNDAFLHRPTPWGDLYKTYGWSQVQRVLRPVRAQILDITSKPTILASKTLKNESNHTATFITSISEQVTDSVSTQWSSSSKIKFEQSIKYDVNFLGTGGGGETKFGFEQDWGKSETKSKSTTVSTATEVSFELKPRESAVVQLSASSGTMRVQITYQAYLTGHVVVNYYPKYKDHHFHSLSIQEVLGNKSNSVEVTEDIALNFYSNASAKVMN